MNNEIKGAILSAFGGMCWGLSGSMGQFLFTHEGMDSRWLVPIRLGMAGLIMLVWSFAKYGKKTVEPWQTKRNAMDLVIYGLLGISLCQFLYFLTIQLSTAGAATILQDLSPIFILLTMCLIEKRKPHGFELGAIILAMAGVFLITTHGNPTSGAVSPTALLAGVACAFCVMIYNVIPKKLLAQYPVILLQGWAFLMGGIFFALIFRIWTVHYIPSLMGYVGIAFVVLVGNVLAFTTYIEGVRLIGPSKAILYGFAEPVTAAIVTFIMMHTAFTVYDALGFVLVFAMLALISFGGKHEAETD